MSGLGLLGTGLAWINYRKKKAAYEALLEQQETLQAIVNEYNDNKYNPFGFEQNNEEATNDIPEGLYYSTILRVSYMVGKMCRVRPSLVVMNKSDKSYLIKSFRIAQCYVLGKPVVVYDKDIFNQDPNDPKKTPDGETVNYTIKPGEVKEFSLPQGITTFVDEDGSMMDKVRQMICDAAGKKLITSCPKINIQGVEDADVVLEWSEDGGSMNTGWLYNIPGLFRYCGELPI